MKRLSIALALLPTVALAHGGHGATEGSHWFTQPDHLIVPVLGGLALALLCRGTLRRLRVARPRYQPRTQR
ncbi:hypothetical protein [Tropicimonas marinistellae]|uniref:hypothetical protein n=1 Tax=Tropicimonas marinistellae TaxID=1739787 RepID=UPI00082E140C|nr:hypothetical protein [Tropicimonas marinistellae]